MNTGKVEPKTEAPVVDFEQVCERSALLRRLKPLIQRLADGPLMLKRFNSDIMRWSRESSPFPFAAALKILGVEPCSVGGYSGVLTDDGPLIVVSNHPFGALEVLCMGSMLERSRPGFKLIGTEYLNKIPAISNHLIAVDSFGRTSPKRRNIQPLREALQHLHSNGALLVYPSGRVSHFRISKLGVTDPEWTPHVVKLAVASNATIVPVYFPGRNSFLFNCAGILHPLLRTLLLVREFYRQAEYSEIKFHFGDPIPASDFSKNDVEAAIVRLRSAVYDLAS